MTRIGAAEQQLSRPPATMDGAVDTPRDDPEVEDRPTGPGASSDRAGTAPAAETWVPDGSADWPPPGTCIEATETYLMNNWAICSATFVYACAFCVMAAWGAMIAASAGYTDLRAWAIPLGRGAGLTLDLNCALLLLPVSKEAIVLVRRTSVSSYLPLDQALKGHKLLAWLIVGATVVHGSLQGVNYILFLELTPGLTGHLSVLITGLVLVVILAAMVATSHPCVRRTSRFSLFWNTHRLYFVFYLLLLIHGVRDGKVTFVYFGALPMLVFAGGRLYRTCWAIGHATTITRAEARDGGVTHLVLPKPTPFLAGQYFDIWVPAISREWHPFTASSAPESPELTFDCKALGDWTTALRSAAEAGRLDGTSIHVRGPFGAPAEHAAQFDHVVMVASGIGATPMVAWIKHLCEARAASARASVALGHGAAPPVAIESPAEAAGAGAGTGTGAGAVTASTELAVPLMLPGTGSEVGAAGGGTDMAAPGWPYTGECVCHPLRTAVVDPVKRRSVPTHRLLRVPACVVALQRVMRSVTLNTVVIFCLVLSQALDYFCAAAAGTHMWVQVQAGTVELASQGLLGATCALLLIAPIVDLWCAGPGVVCRHSLAVWQRWRCGCGARRWQGRAGDRSSRGPGSGRDGYACVVKELAVILPAVAIAVVFSVSLRPAQQSGQSALRAHPGVMLPIGTLVRFLMLVPVWVRFHHTSRSVRLVAHRLASVNRIRCVKFVWVNRYMEDAGWLVKELAELERQRVMWRGAGPVDRQGRRLAPGTDDSHFMEARVFVTRSKAPGDAGASEEAAVLREADNHLRSGVTHGRPNWHELLSRFAAGFPEGDHVGVFYCGAPALGRALRQVCQERTRHRAAPGNRRLRWTFRKEVF